MLSSPGCHQNQGLLTLSRLRPGLQLAGNRRFSSAARVLSACLPSRPALQKVGRGAVVRNDIKDFHIHVSNTTGQAKGKTEHHLKPHDNVFEEAIACLLKEINADVLGCQKTPPKQKSQFTEQVSRGRASSFEAFCLFQLTPRSSH